MICRHCGTHIFEGGEPAEPSAEAAEVARLRRELDCANELVSHMNDAGLEFDRERDRLRRERDALLKAARRCLEAGKVKGTLHYGCRHESAAALEALRAAIAACEEGT